MTSWGTFMAVQGRARVSSLHPTPLPTPEATPEPGVPGAPRKARLQPLPHPEAPAPPPEAHTPSIAPRTPCPRAPVARQACYSPCPPTSSIAPRALLLMALLEA